MKPWGGAPCMLDCSWNDDRFTAFSRSSLSHKQKISNCQKDLCLWIPQAHALGCVPCITPKKKIQKKLPCHLTSKYKKQQVVSNKLRLLHKASCYASNNMKYMKFHNLFDTENKKLNMPCPNYELARMCLTSLETRQLNKIIFAMRSDPRFLKLCKT